MAVRAGDRFGPYVVELPVGSGGMGDVFRARDTRLDRAVALKLLRPELASEPEARERFEREARAIAALSHPHICALHDVGREGDTSYLVMELLEGETLAQRLARAAGGASSATRGKRGARPPLDEIVSIAAEIADALAHAHRRGVVHRDLKPSNVMLTRAGVKLLDFGLAAWEPAAALVDGPDAAPDPESPLTEAGQLLGTLPYMAPEQLAGGEVDARTDLFALGAIVYEMLTLRRAFDALDRDALVAAIVERDPEPPSALAADVPPALDRLVGELLAKDADARWQSAADVARQLRAAVRPETRAPAARGGRVRGLAAGVAIGIATAVAAVLFVRRAGPAPPSAPTTRFQAALAFAPGNTYLAMSPDGATLAFTGQAREGGAALALRDLATGGVRTLDGTRGAQKPFWSPDGRHVAFVAGTSLMRVAVAGGVAERITEVDGAFRGGSWGADDVIVFAAASARKPSAIFRVPATGGAPVEVFAHAPPRPRFGPRFLPDGQRFLLVEEAVDHGARAIRRATLSGDLSEPLFDTDSPAEILAPDHVVHVLGGALLARPFDVRAGVATGVGATITPEIATNAFWGWAAFSAGGSPVLVFRARTLRPSRLEWRDRAGRFVEAWGEPGYYATFALDATAARALVRASAARTSEGTLRLFERDRVTTAVADPARDVWDAAWAPDGASFAYSALGSPTLFRRRVGETRDEVLATTSGATPRVTDWSPDGRWLAVALSDFGLRRRGALVPLAPAGKPVPVAPDALTVDELRFSPDGRFVAFAAMIGDRVEVCATTVPPSDARWQLSTDGGGAPRWRRDGRELFYVARDGAVTSVTVDVEGGALRSGRPRRLFAFDAAGDAAAIEPSPDGARFLVRAPLGEATGPLPVDFLVGWRAPDPR